MSKVTLSRIDIFSSALLNQLNALSSNKQGHFHICAMSCDHEIVRVQKKVSKGCPNTPLKSCSVVMDPQV